MISKNSLCSKVIGLFFSFLSLSSIAYALPVATINGPDVILAGDTAQLTGASSTGNLLQYRWRLVQKPDGSKSQISSGTTSDSSFVIDREGVYLAELRVLEGATWSSPTYKTISAITSGGEIVLNPEIFESSLLCKITFGFYGCEEVIRDFAIVDPAGDFSIVIENDGIEKVFLNLNGVDLTDFYELSGGTETVIKKTQLLAQNQFKLRLGRPGSFGGFNSKLKLKIVRNLLPSGQNTAPVVTAANINYFGSLGGKTQLTIFDPDQTGGHILSVLVPPKNGDITISPTGEVVYVPDYFFLGDDEVVVLVTDSGTPKKAQALIIPIHYQNGNEPPILSTDFPAFANGETVAGKIYVKDTLGQTHTFAIVEQATSGTASVDISGNVTYIPNDNFVGLDTFKIRVTDSGTPSASTDIIIPIETQVNHDPQISNPTLTLEQGMPGFVNFVFSDIDQGQNVTISIKTAPLNGLATIDAKGKLNYKPDPLFYGQDSVEVAVRDNGHPVKETTMILPITVYENKPPVIYLNENNIVVSPGITRSVYVYTADTNVYQTRTVSIVQQPTFGVATLDLNNNKISFTPNLDALGDDLIILSVTDNGFPQKSGFITLKIKIQNNHPPVPTVSGSTSTSGKPLSIWISPNDPDVGQVMSYSISSYPAHGTLVTSPYWPWYYIYTPVAGYTGPDQFKVVVADNGAPIMTGEVAVNINVTGNHAPTIYPPNPIKFAQASYANYYAQTQDIDGDYVAVRVVGTPTLVTASVYGNNIYFKSDKGLSGTETITIEAYDNGTPSLSTTSTMQITVDSNHPPALKNQTILTSMNTAQSVYCAHNDPDSGQIETYTIVNQAANGVVKNLGNGSFTYIPNNNFVGVDAFIVRVTDNGTPAMSSDATITINIDQNFPPEPTAKDINILQNINGYTRVFPNDPNPFQTFDYFIVVQPTNGVASVDRSGNVYFTPKKDFYGQDQIIVSITDSGTPRLSTNVSIAVEVEKNLPPAPTANNPTIVQNATAIIDIAHNDPNIIAQSFSYEVTQAPTNGTLSAYGGSRIIYTPAWNFVGNDFFRVKVTDSGNPRLSGEVTVLISVVPNVIPTVFANNITTFQSTTATTQVSFTDAEPDQTHSYFINTKPLHGSASVNAQTGLLTYTPTQGYSGTDTLTVGVRDSASPNGIGTKDIQITVVGNVIPTVIANNITTFQSIAATTQVSFTDAEPDQIHTYGIQTQPLNGNASIDAKGLLTYTPNLGYSGTDKLTVSVTDNAIPNAVGTKDIAITIVANTNPIVIANDISIFQGANGSVQASFTDPDVGQTHQYYMSGSPLYGSASISADGLVSYSPYGLCNVTQDSFKISVSDNAIPNGVGEKEIKVNITPNTIPVVEISDFNIQQFETASTQIKVTDPDVGETFTYQLTQYPQSGWVEINSTGLMTYHHTGYLAVTTDTFQVTVKDRFGDCTNQAVTKTVNVNIAPNHAPVLAVDDLIIEQGTIGQEKAKATDLDIFQTLNFSITQYTTHGSVSVDYVTGDITYTPWYMYSGADQFKVQVRDNGIPLMSDEKLVNVTVVPLNYPPVPTANGMSLLNGKIATTTVVPNDPDVSQTHTFEILSPTQYGWATIDSLGVITYHAFEGAEGIEVIQVKVTDSGIFPRSGTVDVPVEVVRNLAPAPLDKNIADAVSGMSVQVKIDANDPNQARFPQVYSYRISNAPAAGVATVNTDGLVTYTAPVDFSGNITFDVAVADQGTPVLEGISHITITVGANSAPVVAAQTLSTFKNVSVQQQIAFSDANSSRQTFTYAVASAPTNGTALIDTQGLMTYTPNTDYFGTDSLIVKVTDNGNPALSGVAIYSINVANSTNTPPTISSIFYTTENTKLPKTYDFRLLNLADKEGTVEGVRVNFGDGSEDLVITRTSPIFKSGVFRLGIFSHNYLQSGTYLVNVALVDNEGAQSQYQTTVTVEETNKSPVAVVNFSQTTGSLPLNLTIDSTGSSDSDGSVVRTCLYIVNPNYGQVYFGCNATGGPQVSSQLTVAGVYYAYACVVDDKHARDCRSDVIYAGITPPPIGNHLAQAAIDIDQRQGVAPLNNVNLNALRSKGFNNSNIVEYQWSISGQVSFNNGKIYNQQVSGANQTINFPYPGVYNVSLLVIDEFGNQGQANSQVYVSGNVVNTPTIAAIYHGSGSYQFKMNTFGQSFSYDRVFWDFGNGMTRMGFDPYVYLTSGSVYNVRMEAYDYTGKKYVVTKTIDLTNTITAPNISMANMISQVQLNQNFNLDASATTDPNGPLQFQWWFGDGSDAIDGIGLGFSQISHAYSTMGAKTLRLLVTNAQGISSELEIPINVIKGQLPYIAASVTPNSGLAPLKVNAYAEGNDPDGTVISYAWNFDRNNLGRIQNGQNVSNIYYAQGTYSAWVTVIDNDGNKITQYVDTVNVGAFNMPPVVASANLSTPQNSKLTYDVSFTDNDTIAQLHYFSISSAPTNGTATISDKGRLIYIPNPNFIGTDSLKVKVTDSSSIPASGEATINISVTGNTNQNPVIAGLRYAYGSSSFPRETYFLFDKIYDPDGSVVKLTWDFGDGTLPVVLESNQLQKISNMVHLYKQAGDYAVTLTAVDNQGGTTTQTLNTSLQANQMPLPNFSVSKAGSGPYQITFDASSSIDPDGSIVTYCWNILKASTTVFNGCQNTPINTVTFDTGGDAFVSLLVIDNNQGVGYYETNFNTDQAPSFNPFVGFDTPGTRQGTAPLNLQWGSQSSFAYQNKTIAKKFWSFSDWQFIDNYAQGDTVTANYLFPGTHATRLTVIDSDGKRSSKQHLVYVGTNVPLKADFEATSGSAAGQIYFNAADWSHGHFMDFFLWDFGDGTNAFGNYTNHTYTRSGSYEVSLTVLDIYGNIDIKKLDIQVGGNTPSAIVSGNYREVTQLNSPLTLTTIGNASDVVRFNFGDGTFDQGNISTKGSITHTYPQKGVYRLRANVTSATSGLSRDFYKTVTVLDNILDPQLQMVLSQNGGAAPITVNYSLNYAASFVPTSYQWVLRNNSYDIIFMSTDSTTSFNFTAGGTYYMDVFVKDANGNSDYASYSMNVTGALKKAKKEVSQNHFGKISKRELGRLELLKLLNVRK